MALRRKESRNRPTYSGMGETPQRNLLGFAGNTDIETLLTSPSTGSNQ